MPPLKAAWRCQRVCGFRYAGDMRVLRRRTREGVAQDLDDLLGLAGDRQGGAVDLLEGVIVLGRMQRDQRLAERRGVSGVERGVPLAVLLAEAHDDDIGALDQRARADGVDPGADVVVPERKLLLAEDGCA